MIKGSIAAAAALSHFPLSAFGDSKNKSIGTPVPFLDPQPSAPNRPMIRWSELTDWITPQESFFTVAHYGEPKIEEIIGRERLLPSPDQNKSTEKSQGSRGLSPCQGWNLEIGGLVKKPHIFTLEKIKARPHRDVIATIECSGNGASTNFMGAVGNARWRGVSLASLLRECGLKKEALEVVFFGADEKVEKIKEKDYLQNFARSLSVPDALQDKILLAYEMNGQPLPLSHGGPLRLIVPGWYGVAWVKWLKRIEVIDRRFMGRFMARDYVTIRGEERPDCTIWRETSVTRLNVKSMLGRVVRFDDGTARISGAAWTDGTPLQRVDVRIDDGLWLPARLDKRESKYAWRFWSYDWKNPTPGEHTLVSRATNVNGVMQPTADDPIIKLKKTYYEANQQYPRKIRI